ncbi:MAG TPA: hypothetical protein VIJ62_14995 [Rhizomicrobium sp.]
MADPDNIVVIRSFDCNFRGVEFIEADGEHRSRFEKFRANEKYRRRINGLLSEIAKIYGPASQHRQKHGLRHAIFENYPFHEAVKD